MRHLRTVGSLDDDPLAGVANFFDIGVIFALGFMVALIARLGLPENLAAKDVTIITNPGTEQMEMVVRKGNKVERFRPSKDKLGGEGQRLGIAYRLKSGEMVYVPEAPAPAPPATPTPRPGENAGP
jgi:hypothetical protein